MKPEIYILANGSMAQALACGLREDYKVFIVGRDPQKLQKLSSSGFETLLYEEFELEGRDVILAFKPYALKSVAEILRGRARVVLSVLAQVDFAALSCIKAQNVVRIMPNIAAKYRASTTPCVFLNSKFKDEILRLVRSFGSVYELGDERDMASAMALSGCAPAFLALVAEALANGGVYGGLQKNLSAELVRGLFQSFSALLNHEHPALIKENICSPAGVTIRGVKALEDRAVRAAFIEAVRVSSQ